MDAAHFAVNFFVALFALIDPVGNAPLFAAATAGGEAAGRRLTAAYIAVFAFAFLTLFFLTGVSLLRFFGISLQAFRIAGGVLLFLLGLDMVRGEFAQTPGDATGEIERLSTAAYARKRFEGMIVPFAMPLLIGPGAISTVIIYAGEAGRIGWTGEAAGEAVLAATSVCILGAFWMAGWISRALGRIGTVIVVRVLGLILCAMAVQFIMAGIADSTVGLLRHAAAQPYPAS